MNFVTKLHIIGRNKVLYAYFLRFIANCENNAFYFWHEYYHAGNVVSDYAEPQIFFPQNIGRISFGFVYGALVLLTLHIRGKSCI